jgi:hypothetical protein
MLTVRPLRCPEAGRPYHCATVPDLRPTRVLADFVCSIQPGAAGDVAFDGGERVVEGEVGWQAGGLVESEELEGVCVGAV